MFAYIVNRSWRVAWNYDGCRRHTGSTYVSMRVARTAGRAVAVVLAARRGRMGGAGAGGLPRCPVCCRRAARP
jgi:hypothetical protein